MDQRGNSMEIKEVLRRLEEKCQAVEKRNLLSKCKMGLGKQLNFA